MDPLELVDKFGADALRMTLVLTQPKGEILSSPKIGLRGTEISPLNCGTLLAFAK